MKMLPTLAIAALVLSSCGGGSGAGEASHEAGVAKVKQISAIHERYKAGLTEAALIAFLMDPANAQTFEAYWHMVGKAWWSSRVPPCRKFENWDELVEDRVWALIASESLEEGFQGTEKQLVDVLGEDGANLLKLAPGESLKQPEQPRKLTEHGMERHKHLFPRLFKKYGLESWRDSFQSLRPKINEETRSGLIFHQSGLRKKIFGAYRDQMAAELDAMIFAGEAEYIVMHVPGDTLQGFTSEDLRVISPDVENEPVNIQRSENSVESGDVTIDPSAMADKAAVTGYVLKKGEGDGVELYLLRAVD